MRRFEYTKREAEDPDKEAVMLSTMGEMGYEVCGMYRIPPTWFRDAMKVFYFKRELQ